MVAVTERAKEELKNLLTTNTDSPEARLRLSHDAQGKIELSIDEEKQDDEKIEHEGAVLLLIEEKLSNLLQGITIDTQESEEGVKLVLTQAS
jgi:Fe-S cluster assembly iron-binding protein IscA